MSKPEAFSPADLHALRWKHSSEDLQKRFDSAVAFALRMAEELKQAHERRWSMECPAKNLANAAMEVAILGARLEASLDACSDIRSIQNG